MSDSSDSQEDRDDERDPDAPDDTDDADHEKEPQSPAERFGRWVLALLEGANGDHAIGRAADATTGTVAEVLAETVGRVLPGETVDAKVTQALTEDADRSGTDAGRTLDDVGG